MATKINPNYYGAENTFQTIVTDIAKKSAYTVADLFTNEKYTGGSFDATASPWGIGKSSISSDYQAQATKGATWTIYSNENAKKNTPIWFYNNDFEVQGGDRPEEIEGLTETDWYFARLLYKNRTSPSVELSGNNLLSKLTIDENDQISVTNTTKMRAVTFLDYSKTRVCLNNVYYKINGNPYFGKTSFSNFASGGVTTDAIFGFDFSIRDNYGNVLPIYASIGGGELPIPDYYKTCYYGDEESSWVRPWRSIKSVGYWSIPNLAWREFDSSNGCISTADMEELTNTDCATTNTGSNGWGHSSETLQTFDDVSYHWEMGFTRSASNWWSIDKVNTGDLFASGLYRSYAYMEIDEGEADYESLTKAILHEIAFLGLPFCFSTSQASSVIGSDDIYLPVFDEHMITTGNYANGAASLALPNATWGDVFGVDMPDYDPTYDPDEHPEDDQKDEGDLENLSSARMPSLFSELTFYAMTPLEFYGFIDELNRYYQGRDPEQWTLDFQGANPADYILGVYYTWFDLPINDVAANVKIGPITLPNTTCFKVAEGDTMLRPNRWQYCDFGTKHIDKRRYDFRDYAPYTQIELYLPLAGTIDLDVAYVMDHDISIRYYYNLLTMTGVACVFRDNLLYKTADLQIASQIPLLSTNVGQYQNQIAQLEAARKQNAIRIAAGTASLAVGAATAIATGGAGAASMISGAASVATGLIQQDQINYQLEHTAPSVSTTGAAEANCSLCCGQIIPKLIIKRALTLEVDNAMYASTIGNACCFNDTIGNRSGLVVCGGVDTSGIPATVEEINAIKQALSSGVYV